MRCTIYFLAIICFGISGCATALTEEQLEDRRNIEADDYMRCRAAYAQQHQIFVHRHRTGKPFVHTVWDVREDLIVNGCRRTRND